VQGLEEKQRIEIDYWRTSPEEGPSADSIDNIVDKMSEARVFLDCVSRYRGALASTGKVLELGAGQGWASCIYKRMFPSVQVTTTDISPYSIMSLPKWERMLGVKVDASYACKSYETQEADASVAQVFCYAAAHHFLAHRRTLREIERILVPGGKAFYLYEPATPRYLYRAAHWRVNRKRPEVPEDVLIIPEMRRLAGEAGMDLRVDYYPSLIKRAPIETIYYLVLSRMPALGRILTCSANFIFCKPQSSTRVPESPSPDAGPSC